MTPSKTPENITGQVLSRLFPPLYNPHISVRLENPFIFTKMWTFSLRSNLFASAECLKNVKNFKNEEFQEVEN